MSNDSETGWRPGEKAGERANFPHLAGLRSPDFCSHTSLDVVTKGFFSIYLLITVMKST